MRIPNCCLIDSSWDFGSLCELKSFVSIPLFTFRAFFSVSPNVHYGVHTEHHTLNLKSITSRPRHVGKNNKFVVFKAKTEKWKIDIQPLKYRSAERPAFLLQSLQDERNDDLAVNKALHDCCDCVEKLVKWMKKINNWVDYIDCQQQRCQKGS